MCDGNTIREGKKRRSMMMNKVLLGIGFWVQGLRCFAWMGVNFFLKDGLRVDSATLQLLQSSSILPMVAKPFYGVLSDSFYIFGQHRLPYIAIGAFLQAISWLSIGYLSSSNISFFTITLYLLLGNLGASIVEVANDAIVAETGKQPTSSSKNLETSSSGELQSFVWMAMSIGGVMGNFMGGIAIDWYSPQAIFLLYGILLAIQFFLTISVRESSLGLPKNSSNVRIRKQISDLIIALRKPEISYSIIWFAASYAVVPALAGTMFYYQTEHLNVESSVLGISKVFGQAAMLVWGIMYNQYFKLMSPRKLISAIQAFLAVFMISDLLFVNGMYASIGIPDALYVMVISGFLEVLCFFKILPFSVLMAQLCPRGYEGSIMAFVMSAIALALIISGYLGVALTSFVGVTGSDFSGFPCVLLIQALCTVLPLYWASCIPDLVKLQPKSKEN